MSANKHAIYLQGESWCGTFVENKGMVKIMAVFCHRYRALQTGLWLKYSRYFFADAELFVKNRDLMGSDACFFPVTWKIQNC